MTGRGSKSGRAAVGPLPWFMWSLGALFFCYAFFQRVAPSVLVSDLMRDFGVGAAVLGNLCLLKTPSTAETVGFRTVTGYRALSK